MSIGAHEYNNTELYLLPKTKKRFLKEKTPIIIPSQVNGFFAPHTIYNVYGITLEKYWYLVARTAAAVKPDGW